MENLALKVKLSVLWLFWLVADLVTGMLMLMEPGVIDEIRTGVVLGMEMGPEVLLLGAVIYLLPLVMVVLSLTLKDSANRWTNLILGAVYTVLGLIEMIELLMAPSAYRILMTLVKVVGSALIVWYAWKWPKQEA